jgi:biopolymer transport protein TolR
MAKKKKSIVHSHDATRPAHVETVADINITPLIDVMLVLLIIFMVVTPVTPKGLDIALPQPAPPQAESTPPEKSNQVVLDIQESTILLNKNPVELPALENRLKDIFQTRSDKTIFVKAADKVPYGKVVQAMDIAKGAGVERIGVFSQPDEAAAPEQVAGDTSAVTPR